MQSLCDRRRNHDPARETAIRKMYDQVLEDATPSVPRPPRQVSRLLLDRPCRWLRAALGATEIVAQDTGYRGRGLLLVRERRSSSRTRRAPSMISFMIGSPRNIPTVRASPWSASATWPLCSRPVRPAAVPAGRPVLQGFVGHCVPPPSSPVPGNYPAPDAVRISVASADWAILKRSPFSDVVGLQDVDGDIGKTVQALVVGEETIAAVFRGGGQMQ